MKKINENEHLWVEKYRPQTIQDLIIPDEVRNRMQEWVDKDKQIPNIILLSTNPGLGKTSASKAIANDLEADVMFINASKDNGIDIIRNKITGFASAVSFDGAPKLITLDECLADFEEVKLGHKGSQYNIQLKELKKGIEYPIVSFNTETGEYENDTCEVFSIKVDNLFEVTLEDGITLAVTDKHPFIINNEGKFVQMSILDGLIGEQVVVDYSKQPQTITSVIPIGAGGTVNLTVHKNHTFTSGNGIVTHNCDGLSNSAQESFRGFIEEFTQNARFILTANYANKIIEPILNRLIVFDFDALFARNTKEIAKQCFDRLCFILDNEKVTYTKEDLKPIVTTLYPSVRKMINTLQQSVVNGNLMVDKTTLETTSIYQSIVQHIKDKQYDKCRGLLTELHNPHAFYNYVYKNSSKIFKEESIPIVIMATHHFLSANANARDPEISLAAYCATLMRNVEVKFL